MTQLRKYYILNNIYISLFHIEKNFYLIGFIKPPDRPPIELA